MLAQRGGSRESVFSDIFYLALPVSFPRSTDLGNLLIFNNFDRYCFLQMLFTALDVTIFCQRNELVLLKSFGCSLCLRI